MSTILRPEQIRLMRMGFPVIPANGKGGAPAAPNYSPIMEQDLAFRKEQFAQSQPLVAQAVAASTKATDFNMKMAEENAVRQKEQYERQRAAFAPTELQVAADAYGAQYLSPEEKAQLLDAVSPDSNLPEAERNKRLSAFSALSEERAAQQAQGQAATGLNKAVAQQGRMLGRFGANPARMASIARSLTNEQQLALAGASNAARQGVRDRGVALRANVANMGRGFINTSAQLGSLASQQGAAGVNAANAGANANLQQANFMGQGYTNQANMMNQQYSNQLQGWEAEQKASDMSGVGQLAGMAGMAMMMSSKESKSGRAKVSDRAALEGIKRVPVESWNYKGDGRRHVGPMAEDMHRELGGEVAPGGKAIDVISALGVQHAAIRQLAKEIEGMKRGKAFRDGGMIHGPGTGTSDDVKAVNVDSGEPIRVSNGEYVIPADTVRRVGKEKLDQLVRKTHTPVRRALRG